MAEQQAFVGREAEREQFHNLLLDSAPHAVLVVGQQGMGKSQLLRRIVAEAGGRTDLQCHVISRDVYEHESPDTILSDVLAGLRARAESRRAAWAADDRRLQFWDNLATLLGAEGLRDVLSMFVGDLAPKTTHEQFVEGLKRIARYLPTSHRILFAFDPNKYMQAHSDADWARIARDLPQRCLLLFAQRPDDVLITSFEFARVDNLIRIPAAPLASLPGALSRPLAEARTTLGKRTREEDAAAVFARYQGHPWAVQAALDLVGAGKAVADLPPDPTHPTHGLAREQWTLICQRDEAAARLLKAHAVLAVPAPDDAVCHVAQVSAQTQQRLLTADAYFAGLLMPRPAGREIYHSLLTDVVAAQMDGQESLALHQRARDLLRGRLNAARAAQRAPDAFAARRLPFHVRASSGDEEFLLAVVECTPPLLALGELDALLGLHATARAVAGEGTLAQAALTGNLGLIYRRRGDLTQAEATHRKALTIHEELGHREGMANQYGNLGLIYMTRGDLTQAEAMHRKSLAIEEELGRRAGMASDYGNLGLIYLTRGGLTQAEAMYRQALAIDEELGRREGMAIQHANLGAIFRQRGDLDQARTHWEKARDLFAQIGMQPELEKVEGLLRNLPPPNPASDAP